MTDVINNHPKYAIMEGGVNDIIQGSPKQLFELSWRIMLDDCRQNGVIPVVILIMPWTRATYEQALETDDWNILLKSLAQEYGAIIIDTKPFIGKFRPSGTEGNLWDMIPEYTIDGIHPNHSGNDEIAAIIVKSLN